MSGSLQRYRDRIVQSLDHIVESQADALKAARDAVATALAADRLIHVAGSGHSHLIAEEALFRAGGIAAAQAILDPDLMLHVSASRSSQFERESGRAEKVLAGYDVADAVDHLADRGVTVDIYQSANMQGTEDAVETLIERWKPRLKGL